MPSESKPKIILDCDPGVDDAIAIITACRWANIVGITSVSGNVPVEHTTSNALKMKKLLNIDAPLHSGASRPCLLYTSPSPRDLSTSRMPSSA